MANRLRGFTRMLSTARNSTRKEFSSPAGKKSTQNLKDVGVTDAERAKQIDREVTIDTTKALLKGAAGGLVLGSVICYFVYGWNPFNMDTHRCKLCGR
ncbi:hypothetical protein MKW94_006219 [Papaver nudicaule]|uniref:Uncharacterized protein n=1 Tax=Papaver nudicaule TaxID=74823 RepID=A0AA41UYD8_PAPNU|nr:hypothetical protein [Papaver nudicaule]